MDEHVGRILTDEELAAIEYDAQREARLAEIAYYSPSEVVNLTATIRALQAELQAERANRPAYLHEPEGTPHCYICGLCGVLEQAPDGRYRHPSAAECIGVVTGEVEAAWIDEQAGG